MLACVCQPTETALLFKGGPPVAMGPLGTSSKVRRNSSEVMKISIFPNPEHHIDECTKESLTSLKLLPSYADASGNLLNLRKIERKAKSTKILVNPVCPDSVSDDSNTSKSTSKKWNGKKKRLKIGFTKNHKIDNPDAQNKAISRDEAKEGKKSISCFKIKSREDKSRTNEDRTSGRENYTNENASNSMSAEKPDLIRHSRKSSKETLIDEGTMTDASLGTDQFVGSIDGATTVEKDEVSRLFYLFSQCFM